MLTDRSRKGAEERDGESEEEIDAAALDEELAAELAELNELVGVSSATPRSNRPSRSHDTKASKKQLSEKAGLSDERSRNEKPRSERGEKEQRRISPSPPLSSPSSSSPPLSLDGSLDLDASAVLDNSNGIDASGRRGKDEETEMKAGREKESINKRRKGLHSKEGREKEVERGERSVEGGEEKEKRGGANVIMNTNLLSQSSLSLSWGDDSEAQG